jgi:hypothetical protein
MGFHEGMSVIQIETGKCPATHKLDGISWRHVSDSNRDWEVPSNSQPGWDFMETCQWIQIETGKCPATHNLDGIS